MIFSKYNETFTINHEGDLPLGPGTVVRVLDIRSDPTDSADLEITATIEFKAVVALGNTYEHCVCQGCGIHAPNPDNDGLFYILMNHQGMGICFPTEEDVEDERDVYPVTGWKRIDYELYCGSCAADFERIMADFKASKRR